LGCIAITSQDSGTCLSLHRELTLHHQNFLTTHTLLPLPSVRSPVARHHAREPHGTAVGAGATPGRVGLAVERVVTVEVLLVVLLLVLLVVLLDLLVVELTLVEDDEGGRVVEEEDTLVDEDDGGNTVLCVMAVSDLNVEVGVSGTLVVGPTPAVKSAFPLPLCPSIASAIY